MAEMTEYGFTCKIKERVRNLSPPEVSRPCQPEPGFVCALLFWR